MLLSPKPKLKLPVLAATPKVVPQVKLSSTSEDMLVLRFWTPAQCTVPSVSSSPWLPVKVSY